MATASNFTNTSDSNLPPYPFTDRSKTSVMLELVAACVLLVVGVTGNGLVCYVIRRSRGTKSSMYYFMALLAYADLLVCCVSIPLTIISTQPEPLFPTIGNLACKTIRFIQYSIPPASVAILTATALDRYFHICHPLRFVATTKRTKWLALCCWGYAVLITIPVPLLLSTRTALCNGNMECTFCSMTEAVENELAGSVYLVIRAILTFMIPEAIIIFLYYKVVKAVWDRGSSSTNRVKVNIIKSLAMVVLAFSLSWAPFSVVTKYHIFKYPGQHTITTVELITFWIGLSASVYNPFIYAFYNRNFRDAFREVFLGRKSTNLPIPVQPRYNSMPDIRSMLPSDTLLVPTQRTRAISFSDASSIGGRAAANTELSEFFQKKRNAPIKRATIAHMLRHNKETHVKTHSRRNSDPHFQRCTLIDTGRISHTTPSKTGLLRKPKEKVPTLLQKRANVEINTFHEIQKNDSISDLEDHTGHKQETKNCQPRVEVRPARKPRVRIKIKLAPPKSQPAHDKTVSKRDRSKIQPKLDLLQVPAGSRYHGRSDTKPRASDKRCEGVQHKENETKTHIGFYATVVDIGQF